MSENESNKKPTLKAGDELISSCPICKSNFKEKLPTNVKIPCPHPNCGVTFMVSVFED